MRLLATFPHYFDPQASRRADGRRHGSTEPDRPARVAALRAAVAALHQHFGPQQRQIDYTTKKVERVNARTAGTVDVVICTTRGLHVLDDLDLPGGWFEHRATDAPPVELGYECQAVLRDRRGAYDVYAYFEDDLIVRDPWWLVKLAWFRDRTGPEALLLPNRYEVGTRAASARVYIDGPIPDALTAPFEPDRDRRELRSEVLGQPIRFVRPSNPHAGCYALSAPQLERWTARPDFLDRSAAFIGPLESAATLGLLRTFRIYKPAPENASFFEIEHAGTQFLGEVYSAAAGPHPRPGPSGRR